jgi:hypothetical protein
MALCYGDYQTVLVNDSQAIIQRQYLNETAIMVINRGSQTMQVDTYVNTSILGTLSMQWNSTTMAAGSIQPQATAIYIYKKENQR